MKGKFIDAGFFINFFFTTLGYALILLMWFFRIEEPQAVIGGNFLIATLFLFLSIFYSSKPIIRLVNLYCFLVWLLCLTLTPFIFIDNFVLTDIDATHNNINFASTLSVFYSGTIIGMIFGACLVRPEIPKRPFSYLNIKFPAFLTIAFIAPIVAYLNLPGGGFFEFHYGAAQEIEHTMRFGMGSGIVNILILILFVDLLFGCTSKKLIVFCISFFLAVIWFSFLRGGRVETLGIFLALYFVSYLSAKELNLADKSNFQFANNTCKFLQWSSIFLILAALFIGVIRYIPVEDWLNAVEGILNVERFQSNRLFEDSLEFMDHILLPTWSNVNYSSMVYMYGMDNSILDFGFFGHYWNIFRATLPVFFDPSRPDSLAVLVLNQVDMTNGGIAFPATFYEGGGAQMILISMAYGFMLEYVTLRMKSAFTLLLVGIFAITSFRVILYGEESLYKYVIALIIIYSILRFTRLLQVEK